MINAKEARDMTITSRIGIEAIINGVVMMAKAGKDFWACSLDEINYSEELREKLASLGYTITASVDMNHFKITW